MYRKLAVFCLILIVAVTTSSQRRPETPSAPGKPIAARFTVKGTYEEIYQGRTDKGSAEGKLTIQFEATRWLTMSTNEVGNAEFSDLANAPAPSVSGSASYAGQVQGSSGGDSYKAKSIFAGPLSGDDVVLSIPEYTDTSNGFKIKVLINPKLKGKCSLVEVRNGETGTSSECANGTYFFTPSTPLGFDDNEEPSKTDDTANLANFGIELDIEPELSAAGNSQTGSPAGDDGVYAWRGAVTNGSKDAGFKINLVKTKELPSEGQRGQSTRRLTFNATIVPGAPNQ